MSKKLITACLAVFGAAAFILPAASSASPVITHPTGTVLNPAGKTCTTGLPGICITGTNVGNINMWNTGHTTELVTCTNAVVTGSLITNENKIIEGQVHSATFTGNQPENKCDATFGTAAVETNIGNGVPWCVKNGLGGTDAFTVTGGACGSPRSITLVLTSTIGICKYSRTGPVEGTFTTHSTGDAALRVVPTHESSFTKEEGGILCPASFELEMSLTLETDTTTKDPLYIS
jgi:hypothetical protein